VPGKLLIGYGNRLRQDDGIGSWIADLASGLTPEHEDFRVLAATQLLPEHAALIAENDLVIFADSSRSLPAGEVNLHRVNPEETQRSGGIHDLAPSGLLSLARELYGAAPQAWLLAVGGGQFDLGEGLTIATEKCAAEVLRYLRSVLSDTG
jgi:hydrogenase maturation protease